MILCQKLVRKGAFLLVSVAGLVSVCACDDTYDLSNVSTDITIGGNISLPVGSTDTLRLERAIELSGNLKVDENGVYALQSIGSMAMKIAKVNQINIKNLKPDPVERDLFVSGVGSGIVESLPISIPFAETMSIDQQESVPAEVESVTKIEIEPVNTELVLNLTLDNIAVLSKLDNLKVLDFVINLPKGLVFAQGIEGFDYNNNALRFTRKFDSDGYIRIPLKIIGLKKLPPIVGGSMHFYNEFTCQGELSAVGKNVTASDFRGFKLNILFDIPNFYVSKIFGKINSKVDIQDSMISLADLPGELTDGKTDVNMNTVGFAVDIVNPVGVPFDAVMTMTALDKKGVVINEQVKASLKVNKAVDFDKSSVTKLYVTNSETVSVPSGYERVVVPNLNKLIGKVPTSIKLQTEVIVDKSQEHFFELGKSYNSQANYVVDVPFDLGAGSHIIYREEIDNLNSDLSDIADKVPAMEVYADIFSTIPLALDVDILPIDIYGNDMSSVLEYTEKISLDHGYENAPSQAKQIVIRELKPGALENLDRIELAVDGGVSASSVFLKPSQYLYLKMKAKLPNGVNIREDK